MVVGIGPGDPSSLTPEAQLALQQAEVVVGYKTYIDLIINLVANKEIIATGMTTEVHRAERAVEFALKGKRVAVVSSGDPGVYGMAGLILEVADGRVPVKVIPGVTAATAAAASLGAPLMHDFAVVSLSDLLTPWKTILSRLQAAAAGDFVIVLYNPKSQGRQQHLAVAREALLWHRHPDTPVGIVRNARRGEETTIITTLEKMLDYPVDMLTTIIIGNSQTRVENGYMITPRGYKL